MRKSFPFSRQPVELKQTPAKATGGKKIPLVYYYQHLTQSGTDVNTSTGEVPLVPGLLPSHTDEASLERNLDT